MDEIFLVYQDKEYSYREFIDSIGQKPCCPKYLYIANNNPYEIFVGIVHSMIHRYPLVLLDGDFSELELERLGISKYELEQTQKSCAPLNISSIQELLANIRNAADWLITLYTSGTAGPPKKVTHSIASLLRNVKIGSKFEGNVWAFAYNPTHIAGLQVLFQALLNHNTIIYVFNVQHQVFGKYVEKYKISNISATSTYYRSVTPFLEEQFPSVQKATFGGERFDSQIVDTVRSKFPNAQIVNIYASTEAGSLFSSHGELFEIDPTLARFVRINADNELLLHRSLLGDSDSFLLQEDWLPTGDIIEKIDDRHFRFVSRISDYINIGGYNVNPHEVEECVLQVPGVLDAVVKAKANRITGHIMVADVIKAPSYDEKLLKIAIKQYAAEHLQQWKVPRIIQFVEQIDKSRTAKKVRK